jgi:DNA-binding HxlR family transcriptional regulator
MTAVPQLRARQTHRPTPDPDEPAGMTAARGNLARKAAQRSRLAPTLGLITGRWVLSVLDQLATGPKRHTELRETIDGISEKMLTQTLRRMQRDGLVTRVLQAGVPGRAGYRATNLARSLDLPLRAAATWQEAHWDQVARARSRWDERPR